MVADNRADLREDGFYHLNAAFSFFEYLPGILGGVGMQSRQPHRLPVANVFLNKLEQAVERFFARAYPVHRFHTPIAQLQDAIGLMDALSIKDVHWVGLSMGGMIGQCLGLNHANRIHSLVLCDTSAIVPNEMQPVWQERIDKARTKGMEALVEETMERWFTASYIKKNPEMFKVIRRQFLATPVQGFIGCGEAIRKLNYLDRLSLINKPTLIIVGDDDPAAPVAGVKGIQERIKGSKLAVLPSARHISNVEQADAFNAALLEFLRAL